jgi:dolichol-phosphate mannosyltransferase
MDPAPRAPGSPLLRQAGAYFVAGGLAAVVDISLFHLLVEQSEEVLASAIASFLVAAAFNYSLSCAWVYRRDWRSWRRAGAFLLFAMAGLCVNAGVTLWLLSAFGLHPTLAKAGGVAVAFGANFLMNTFIVFQRIET